MAYIDHIFPEKTNYEKNDVQETDNQNIVMDSFGGIYTDNGNLYSRQEEYRRKYDQQYGVREHASVFGFGYLFQ